MDVSGKVRAMRVAGGLLLWLAASSCSVSGWTEGNGDQPAAPDASLDAPSLDAGDGAPASDGPEPTTDGSPDASLDASADVDASQGDSADDVATDALDAGAEAAPDVAEAAAGDGGPPGSGPLIGTASGVATPAAGVTITWPGTGDLPGGSLVIPPLAVTAPTTITVSLYEAGPDAEPGKVLYVIEPEGLPLAVPGTLTLGYRDAWLAATGIDESQLIVAHMWTPPAGTAADLEGEPLQPSARDTTANLLSVQVDHFSWFDTALAWTASNLGWHQLVRSGTSGTASLSGNDAFFSAEPGATSVIVIHGLFSEYSKMRPLGDAIAQQLGSTNVDVVYYDYPWWRGIRSNGEQLAKLIRDHVSSSQPPKYVLVGHSMGGLVARAALEYGNIASYVSHLVTLGTPHEGAPLATDLLQKLVNATVPKAAAASAMNWLKSSEVSGPSDLQPGSAFLQQLANGAPGGKRWGEQGIPYFTAWTPDTLDEVVPDSSEIGASTLTRAGRCRADDDGVPYGLEPHGDLVDKNVSNGVLGHVRRWICAHGGGNAGMCCTGAGCAYDDALGDTDAACVECDGSTLSAACGNCGTTSSACDLGAQLDWTSCAGQGACAAGSTRSCGSGGTEVCSGSCAWSGVCGDQTCSGTAPQRSCGNCGTQSQICDTSTGQWGAWGTCTAQGACAAGATRSCGSGGTEVCSASCAWSGVCGNQTCPGSAPQQACGNCGTQSRICDTSTGLWGGWGTCTGQGACTPGSTRTCGNNGTESCTSSCTWSGVCGNQTCSGTAPQQACGNCGTQSRICDTSTGQWGGWGTCTGQGVCSPGSTTSCGTGSATRTCTASCAWGSCLGCGNGTCDSGESCSSCPTECGCGTGAICSSNACVSCGSTGQPCCTGNTCSSSSLVCTGVCTHCGNAGELCCTSGTPCGAGLSCNGSTCQAPSGTILFTESFEAITWDQYGQGTLSDGIAVWDSGGPTLRTRMGGGNASAQSLTWYGGGVSAAPSSATMTLPYALDSAKGARVTFDSFAAGPGDMTIQIKRGICSPVNVTVSASSFTTQAIDLPACGSGGSVVFLVGAVYAYPTTGFALKIDNIKLEYP